MWLEEGEQGRRQETGAKGTGRCWECAKAEVDTGLLKCHKDSFQVCTSKEGPLPALGSF